jgi:hypothetical protein
MSLDPDDAKSRRRIGALNHTYGRPRVEGRGKLGFAQFLAGGQLSVPCNTYLLAADSLAVRLSRRLFSCSRRYRSFSAL